MNRGSPRQVALALRIENHILGLGRSAPGVEIAPPLAPGEVEIEERKKKVGENKNDYEPQHRLAILSRPDSSRRNPFATTA
jgi:hypothetical protein